MGVGISCNLCAYRRLTGQATRNNYLYKQACVEKSAHAICFNPMGTLLPPIGMMCLHFYHIGDHHEY
jgi:hypothetical protein